MDQNNPNTTNEYTGAFVTSETTEVTAVAPVKSGGTISDLAPLETPTVPATEDAKPKLKKGLKIGIIAAIVAVLLAVGGVFAYMYLFNPEDEFVNNCGRDVTNKELAKLSYEEVTELEFHPNVAYTKKDLEKALKAMEERVKVLGNTYEFKLGDDKITLIIEKKILGNTAFERTQSVELIKSNGMKGLGSDSFPYGEIKTTKWKAEKTVDIKKSDLLDDYKDMLDEDTIEQFEATDAKTFKVLKVTIDGDSKAEFEDDAEYIYPDYELSLWHNVTDYGNRYVKAATIVFPDDDKMSEFYLVSPASAFKGNSDLLKQLIDTRSIKLSFDVQVKDDPAWETKEKNFGANQVSEMKGKTVVIECTPDKYTLNYSSEENFEKHIDIIKNRLDCLDVDYMFGKKGIDDKTICVRISPKDISLDFIRFIFNDGNISVRSAFDNIHSFGTRMEVTGGSKPGIKINAYTANGVAEIKEEYNITNGVVYLVVNDVTVATAYIDDFNNEEESLTFNTFTCFGKDTAGKSEAGFLDLIASIDEEEYTSFTPENFNIRYFDGDKEKTDVNINDIEWKYSSLTSTDVATMKVIRDMGYDVYKHINARNMLVITLDVKRDENLPVNFFEKVKAIYTACDFDSGAYSQIHFVLKDEKKESFADTFRVEFTKDMYDGEMEYTDSIGGPTFFDYWSDAYEYLEADSFFVERDL